MPRDAMNYNESLRERYGTMSMADVQDWSGGDHWPGDTWGRYTYSAESMAWCAPTVDLSYYDLEGGV